MRYLPRLSGIACVTPTLLYNPSLDRTTHYQRGIFNILGDAYFCPATIWLVPTLVLLALQTGERKYMLYIWLASAYLHLDVCFEYGDEAVIC